jgi:CO/xanthine dehydrogenase FAD-binding subunit
MIPFDFVYYRPDTLKEAAELYSQLSGAGKRPVYYGGGSELLSMARTGNLRFGAVIDLKGIPQCTALDEAGDNVIFGASLTLAEIIASKKFPLLEKTAGRIADHTMQNKITLGGNLMSAIIYREAILPLLLTDAGVISFGVNGLKSNSIHTVFNEKLQLPQGELLVQTAVSKKMALAPYFHEKKTKNEKIDYPLLTAAAIIADGALRIAFSGLAPYPFRDIGAEKILADLNYPFPKRAELFAEAFSGVIQNNSIASAEYRRFILKNTVAGILEAVKKADIPCLC